MECIKIPKIGLRIKNVSDKFVFIVLDNTTKMSYHDFRQGYNERLREEPMTRFERLLTPSTTTCCVCDHPLSVQELEEFRGSVDDDLYGEVHCRACTEEHLVLCSECSGRYTADGFCGECAAREYAMAG